MKQSVPKSIDEYIAAQPEAVRPKLEQVRAAIRRAVPEAVEGIGYRMPGYKLHGKPMLYFAAFKEHYSLFAASGTFFAALEDELRGYELRKGTVHFPLAKPVPVKLISRIAKLRAAGIAAIRVAIDPVVGYHPGGGPAAALAARLPACLAHRQAGIAMTMAVLVLVGPVGFEPTTNGL